MWSSAKTFESNIRGGHHLGSNSSKTGDVMDEDATNEALRARIRDLSAALRQENQSFLVAFRLTPALNNLLGLLYSVELVTTDMIQQRLEIATEAKVAIHRLRKHMEDFGVVIESRRHLGYWLSSEAKEIIRRLVDRDPVPPGVTEVPPVPLAPAAMAVAA